MKYFLITFGCQMNHSDSEKISFVFESKGYKPALKLEKADLVVINMCSIRQSAVDRVYGVLENLKKLASQQSGSKVKTILTGCILKKDRKKFKELFDYILDIKDLTNLKNFKNWPKELNINSSKTHDREFIMNKNHNISAYVPIMTECNNFCSYCVVPYTRGREISRPLKEIVCEVENLVKRGTKEIWLLGQNVNSYKHGFPKLLRRINKIPGKFWIRFTSSHPKDFSDDLIKVMKKCNKITPYLNLPIQSGDDKILRKMNRPYAVKKYKNIIKKIRKEIPNICLSTDIIVGFPGETKKQFQNTAKLFKEIKYDMAYINKYSPRSGTAAAKLINNISEKEKKEREKVLNEILKKTALKNNKKYIGKTIEALMINSSTGKTETNKTLKINSKKDFSDKFIKVKITNALPWGLKGEYVNNKILVIVGPTASGKTDLSIRLAKKFGGEIISADSRQVYKGMDIGTGKVTKKEMQGIPHHLLDVIGPKTRFDIIKYRKLALKVIEIIQKKNKVPILVGGTGFYIQAVIDGIIIPPVKPDWKLRKKLDKKTAPELFKMLKKLDPRRAKIIEKENKRRLIRALEIIIKTKNPVPPLTKKSPGFDILMIGIKKSDKELKKAINKRLLKRFSGGMLAEVKKLHKQGISWKRLEEFGLEYRYLALYIQNKITKQKMIERLEKKIEHYAKRQMTWFKRDKRIKWIKNYKQASEILKKQNRVSEKS